MLEKLNQDGRLEAPSRFKSGDTVYYNNFKHKVIRPSQFLKGVICAVEDRAVFFDDKVLSESPAPLTTFSSQPTP